MTTKSKQLSVSEKDYELAQKLLRAGMLSRGESVICEQVAIAHTCNDTVTLPVYCNFLTVNKNKGSSLYI